MKRNQLLKLANLPLLAGFLCASTAPAQINLTPLGTYSTGVFDEGAAEIVAHDPGTQRLFVINALAVTVDVLSIANPAAPVKVGTINAAGFGSSATSVSVKDGVVAVSIAAPVPTDAGKVVFFDAKRLNVLNSVTVGALPDMVTFSKDGRWVLTANEGQPSEDYSVDPEGSVSVIDMSAGARRLKQSDVRTATFTAFNGATLDASIRIYGKNTSGVASTVAQDLEPEYITISRDGQTAYVTCQENNAIAIVDIASATVTALKGLGFKDYSKVDITGTEIFEFGPLPLLGTTAAGQQVFHGGFSGLHYEGINPTSGDLKFVTHTDRGPNGEPISTNRPFVLPNFTPEIVRFELNRASGALTLTERIQLKRADGSLLTGLPNSVVSASASTPYNDEVPIDLFGNTLALDPLGGDFEGIVIDPADGTFWMCDEYRPAIYHFDTSGKLIKRFVPIGTASASGQIAGTFGEEVLPAVLAQRRQNRGFEAIALSAGKIYAWVQSPLRNPASASNGSLNTNRSVRVVEFNPVNNATRQFLQVMDNPNLGGSPTNSRADKIGDAVALGGGEFLVIERDDDSVSNVGANLALIEKKIYRLNLAGATDITTRTNLIGGKTVDQLTLTELATAGIVPIGKVLHVDLNAAGYNQVEKVEGLALINQGLIAVINDNDFNIGATPVNTATGTFTPDPTPIQLGLIGLGFNGIDASDRDSLVNIRQWPVRGMFQPDGIAAFTTDAGEFLITANEGDARAYAGFNEETRVASVTLDPTAYPFGPALKNNAQLGRLRITNKLGDTDGDGDIDQLYAYGARSFSIWSTDGALVFDSLDGLEQLIANNPALRSNFNANHTVNTADDRSDDKGPEPEGVTIGKVGGGTYAFVGLERMSAILVVDLTNPFQPAVVQYISNRNFGENPSLPGPVSNPAAGDLGPEGIIFIPSDQSPNGKALLVVGNEVSGTTSIYQIDPVQ